MNEEMNKCLADLYKASEWYDGTRGDYLNLRSMYGKNIPFSEYYIAQYKLYDIINEYIGCIEEECEKKRFADAILKYAPTTSRNRWEEDKKEFYNKAIV